MAVQKVLHSPLTTFEICAQHLELGESPLLVGSCLCVLYCAHLLHRVPQLIVERLELTGSNGKLLAQLVRVD